MTLIVFGLYSVLVGLFMFVAPGTFFDTLGNFGARKGQDRRTQSQGSMW